MMEPQATYYPNIPQSWGILGMAILFMILLIPVNILADNVAGSDLSFLVYYLSAMGATFWFAHSKRRATNVTVYHLDKISFKTMVVVSIATISIQTGIASPIVSLIPMPEFVKNVIIQFAGQRGPFTFITVVILAPVLEELIFRGIILDGLLSRYTPLRSIVLSSILFGLLHLNPWQFVSALILGLFSGWVYYKTRSLTWSILIHFVNNLFAFGSAYFMDTENSVHQSLPALYGGHVNFAIAIACAITIAMISLYVLRSDFNESSRVTKMDK